MGFPRFLKMVMSFLFSPAIGLTFCLLSGLCTGIFIERGFAKETTLAEDLKLLANGGVFSGDVGNLKDRLGRLRSIEVETLEPRSQVNPAFPAELTEAVRTGLQDEHRLPYDSPGEGTLRLSCDNKSCNRILAEVTMHKPQTVIWSMRIDYKPAPLEFLPDAHKAANQIIAQLLTDYQESITPLDNRIPIRD
jgi:hypothetical protein